MKIYRSNQEIYDLRPEYGSTQRVVHMGENVLNLTFRTASPLDLRVNDFTVFADEKYRLKQPVGPTRKSRHEFEYRMKLFSPQYDLQDALYVLEDGTGAGILDGTVPLFGTASFHLEQIVKCARTVHPEWNVGDVEEPADGKNIVYADMDCLQALQHLCEEFNIEYWITGTTVSLGKRKFGSPIPFRYGKGSALYDLSRENRDGRIVTKLLVKGGDRNIDSGKYGSKFLHLPDGGQFVEQNTDKFGVIMGRVSFPDVFPRLVHRQPGDPGSVTGVRTDEHGVYWLKDANLDFSPELLPGKTLSVDFQTGQLGGLKIDANWHEDTKEYELIAGDYGLGQDVPGSIFVPAAGDLYLLSGLKMPQAYIDAAERELLERGREAIAQMCEQKVSYRGTVNPLFFRELDERPETGRAVIVEDGAIVDGDGAVELRVQAFTRGVNDDLEIDIEISDTVYISRIDRIEQALQEVKVETDERINWGDAYTLRRFRDAAETIIMLAAAQLNFSEAVNPITVHTMQLLVGDESLQFRFVNSRTNPQAVNYLIVYNKNTKMLRCPSGILQHMTLGLDSLAATHTPQEYHFWDMPLFESSPLTESAKKYFLYARVPETGNAGMFLLSESSIAMKQVAGYYHLLAGILNSEFEGERSFVPLYGFTEILPGRITTDRIVSTDGLTFINLLNNMFHFGSANSYLDYNTQNDGLLRLKGMLVQSPSGVEEPVGVFRGAYGAATTYYRGDEVTYLGSTYRYINTTPSAGRTPPNAAYWAVVGAKGDPGTSGSYTSFVFKQSAAQPATPTDTSPIPVGWSDAPVAAGSGVTNVSHSGPWVLQPDGTRRSPAIVGGGFTKNRIAFTTPAANQAIVLRLKVSSETNYDFALVGLPDSANMTLYANFADRISGEMERTVSVNVPSAGSHFIEVGYGKDSTVNSGQDCAWYEVVTDDMWWMSKSTVTHNGSTWAAGAWSVPVRVTGEDGQPGADGKFWDYKYCVSTGQPDTPQGLQPSGWYDNPPGVTAGKFLWMSYCEKNAEQTAILWGWSTPVRISGEQGETGPKGDSPAPVFRGDYGSGTVYYGTASRVDIVKYGGYYYVAKTTAGNGFSGQTPTNTACWALFGAQFESVATKLLLAEYANIGGLIFRNSRLESADGSFYIDGNNNVIVIGKGVFKGSLATPFTDYQGGWGGTLTLTDNFNYTMSAYGGTQTIYLPTGQQYDGIICRIYNRGITGNEGAVRVRSANGRLSQNRINSNVEYIDVPPQVMGIFQYVYFNSTINGWICLNYKEMQS
ncbi:MAG: hypothetical protein LBJ01_07640 [Tannerella sp.]|jgi:hypothetical protein|nr:hypothetical protein [Tannerella sp.]